MRQIIFILTITLLLPAVVYAQDSKLNQFFNKYSGQEGYASVYITEYMFDLLKKVNSEKEEEKFEDITSNLKGIKILMLSEGNAEKKAAFLKEINEMLNDERYKELMIVREGDETVTFMIHEDGDRISEFVMKIDGQQEPGIIFLEGSMTLRQISELSGKMDVKGFDHLDEIDKHKNK